MVRLFVYANFLPGNLVFSSNRSEWLRNNRRSDGKFLDKWRDRMYNNYCQTYIFCVRCMLTHVNQYLPSTTGEKGQVLEWVVKTLTNLRQTRKECIRSIYQHRAVCILMVTGWRSVYVMRGTRSDLSPAAINQPDTTNPVVLWSAEYLSPVTRKRVLRWGSRLNIVDMMAQHFVAQIYTMFNR